MSLFHTPYNLKGEKLATEKLVSDNLLSYVKRSDESQKIVATSGSFDLKGSSGFGFFVNNVVCLSVDGEGIKTTKGIEYLSTEQVGQKLIIRDGVFSIKDKEILIEGKNVTGGRGLNVSATSVNFDTVLKYNGHEPNTASGFVVLDSNGKVESSFLPVIDIGVKSFAGSGGDVTISSDFDFTDNQLKIKDDLFLKLTNQKEITITNTESFTFSAENVSFDVQKDILFDAESIKIVGLFYLNGALPDTAGGVVLLDSNGKIKSSQLPSLAIDKVYSVLADGSLLINLIKKAITDAGDTGVHAGDLVMIYRGVSEESDSSSLTGEYYDSVCGEYFILSSVSVADITEVNFKKTYRPIVVNLTVNGISPVDNNISLSIGNLNDIDSTLATVLKSISVIDNRPSISGIPLAKRQEISNIYYISNNNVNLSNEMGSDIYPGTNSINTMTRSGILTIRINTKRSETAGFVKNIFSSLFFGSSTLKKQIIPDVSLSTVNSVDYIILSADFGTGYDFTGKIIEINILSPIFTE